MRESGAGTNHIGGAEFSHFLDEHWDELNVEIVEDGEYDADQLLWFVKIEVPDELVDELITMKNGRQYTVLRKEALYEALHGTKQAFENRKMEEDRKP